MTSRNLWLAVLLILCTPGHDYRDRYIASLESVLARCLGDREGRIDIGGRVHLCKAIDIGERVKVR